MHGFSDHLPQTRAGHRHGRAPVAHPQSASRHIQSLLGPKVALRVGAQGLPSAAFTIGTSQYTLRPRSGLKAQVEIRSADGKTVGQGHVIAATWPLTIRLGNSAKLKMLGWANDRIFWSRGGSGAGRDNPSSRVGCLSYGSTPYLTHSGDWAGLYSHFNNRS